MKLFCCAQLLFAIMPLVVAFEFTPIPMYYVTQSDITSSPKEMYAFNVPLCGGEQFEHFKATIFINFPDKKWNPMIGDYVFLQVLDVHDHALVSNKDGNSYIDEFNFLYHKQYSDLHLHVTSGNAPTLKYTITVTFTNTTSRSSPPLIKTRYYKSEFEKLRWNKLVASMPEGNTQEMLTVFKTSDVQTVPTADAKGFHLGYCFDPDQFPGSVYISTVSTDEISGLATYACTNAENCTSTEAAKFYDTTGASVNFVKVDLKTSNQAGPINVLVRGDGRDEQINRFTLSASKFVPCPKSQNKYVIA